MLEPSSGRTRTLIRATSTVPRMQAESVVCHGGLQCAKQFTTQDL